jgi:hypothetical protein
MVSGVNYYQISAFRPNTDEIEDWVECLNNFIVALNGIDCDAARKLAILKTVIGDEAALAIRNFQPAEKDTYAHLTALKLKSYYKPVLQTSTYRHQFYNQYQEEAEPVEDLTNRLLDLASKCGFRALSRPAEGNNAAVYHNLTNEFVIDRSMVGLRDESTRARLMREKNIWRLQQRLLKQPRQQRSSYNRLLDPTVKEVCTECTIKNRDLKNK